MSKRHARHDETAALVRYYQAARAMTRRKARTSAHATMVARTDFTRWLDTWPGRARCVTCDEMRYTVQGGGCAACRRLYG